MAKRKYRQKKRAEKAEQTRQKIVQAAMELHEELGPGDTTISAIAQRAGVQRLTVYRHFEDEGAIFRACSAHWAALNPPPDPTRWTDVAQGLRELYAFFSATREMLHRVYRDRERAPAMRPVLEEFDGYLDQCAALLLKGARAGKAKKATLQHALQFSTWESLEDLGLSDRQKVETVEKWLSAI